MIKQTKEHRDHHSSRLYLNRCKPDSNSKQKRAGISHGEDCWIHTLEIDGIRKQLSRPGMSMVNFVVKRLPDLTSHAMW